MTKQLDELIQKIEKTPGKIKSFSEDEQQTNPLKRMTSIVKILQNLELPPPGSTVIDIGTGYGYGAVALHLMGYNVLGVDIGKGRLMEGKKYWSELGIKHYPLKYFQNAARDKGPRLYFTRKDAAELPQIGIPKASLATAFYISPNMLLKDGPLWKAGEILEEGGKLIVTTQGPTHPSIKEKDRILHVKGISKNTQFPGMIDLGVEEIKDPDVYDKFVITRIKK